MKDFPADPMRQHNRFMAAFCDDLFDMVVHKTKGTPRADRVCEISRQLHAISTERDGRVSNKPRPTSDNGK